MPVSPSAWTTAASSPNASCASGLFQACWLTCTPQEAFSFGSIFLLWQYADRQRDAGCSTVAEIALNVPNTDLDHAEASGPRPGVQLSRFSTAKRRDGPAFGRSRS